MKYFQCLMEVTATRQKTRMRVEQRLVQLSLSEEEVLGCSCKGRAQGMRGSCSCYSALASRLWQPGLAQEVIFRMKWRIWVGWSEEKWGASVTGWTPGRSPGCHHGGCCCWSHCHSSGGWSSWPPPATSSTCSSVERAERWECLPVCWEAHPGLFGAPATCSRLASGVVAHQRGCTLEYRVLGSDPGCPAYQLHDLERLLSPFCGISLLVKLNSIYTVPAHHVEVSDELIYAPHCE